MDTFFALGTQGVFGNDTTGKKSHFGYIIVENEINLPSSTQRDI